MGCAGQVLVFVCLLATGAWAHSVPSEGHAFCPGLAVYTAVFIANWTRDAFPKQYPEFRPPAQWSRVVGITHNAKFRLYQLGGQASPELKLFAETGRQELLGNAPNRKNVLDEFLLAAIKNGSGRVEADFIVDSDRSQVSLASRIVPSPDWFVGIDSLDLCSDGRWVDDVTVEASPLDAGTDSGFTFTAPNWATQPQEPIYKITAQYPRHPANSFFYPRLNDLPPIATFHLFKKGSYHEMTPGLKTSNLNGNITSSTDAINITTDMPVEGDDMHQNDILPWKHMKRKLAKKKRSKKHKLFKVKKCLVGEWSEWSACNAPCGQSKRTRKVEKLGELCPPLLEVRTCGCTKYIFDW